MRPKIPEEKVKPFRLVKYFTFTSIIAIFIGTIVLSVMNIHWARSTQRQKSEDYALLLVENLNHQVFLQFIIPVALKYGKIQLSNPEQFERMDKVVRSTLHSFNVEQVNIYNMNDTISYSFDKALIGKQNAGGTIYKKALKGSATSIVEQRGSFWEILLGISKENKIITFAPLRAERPLSTLSGPVLGVVEIVQDLSDEYKTIFSFQIRVIITGSSVMCALFLALLLVVKRGERISQKRAQEEIKLREQLDRAERLSSIGEMVAGVSHEIRNPLGIIISSAELLKKKTDKPDDRTNRITQIIIEESRRLNNIITDFLNFARPRRPNLVPCRIEEIIDKNIIFLEPEIKSRGYTIFKKFQRDQIPEINADASMLYQAFLNLLINAMQAMPAGGEVHVEISTDDENIQICIEDEGKGIAEEQANKIWDPFFTTKEKGTGLGLGIVKNIIEAHAGKIIIENRKDSGARVVVTLPIKLEG
ncbi:MAG: two-component sensor histidine kinase [Desulfobacterales bacterium]|nr:two-component sensor histidine kinase [Desulfobacterales bacterium]